MATKPIIKSQTFQVSGDFQSMYAAQRWLKENGYSYGSNSVFNPTAVMKGNYADYDLPWKMKNFTKAQKNQVHGLMNGDFRNGPVRVDLFE